MVTSENDEAPDPIHARFAPTGTRALLRPPSGANGSTPKPLTSPPPYSLLLRHVAPQPTWHLDWRVVDFLDPYIESQIFD